MKIYSWNVNGIRAVETKGLLKVFIEQEKPDIVCFQETKAQESQLNLDYPEYHKYWNSAEKKGYSGTSIWSKTEPLTILRDIPGDIAEAHGLIADDYGNPAREGRVLAAEYEDFYLLTVYTPNSKGDLSRLSLRDKQWDPAFLAYAARLNETKPVLFCGDLNVAHKEIDLANPKPNVGKHGFTKEERAGFDNMLRAGFYDTFRAFHEEPDQYSWWTHWAKARGRNVGWRIDYFVASETLRPRINQALIHQDVMGSDHCPVSVDLK